MPDTAVTIIKNCTKALAAFAAIQDCVPHQEVQAFLFATISFDGQEWWIASGPNVMRDRSGFGKTIQAAVKDYFNLITFEPS